MNVGCVPAACCLCSPKAEDVLLNVVLLQLLYWVFRSCLMGLWAGTGPGPLAGNQQPSPTPPQSARWRENQPKVSPGPTWRLNIYKDQDYKSALYISQPSGLMPAEIWNCLYCMYGHLGYCFQNYFWQRSVEVEEQCLKEEIILSLKGLVLAIRIYYYKAYLCHSLSKKNPTSIIPDNCRNN